MATDFPEQTIPLDTWQTEEKTIPTQVMDESGKPTISERVVKQRYMHAQLIP